MRIYIITMDDPIYTYGFIKDIIDAKKNNIDFYIIEPQERKINKKSYAENFLKK